MRSIRTARTCPRLAPLALCAALLLASAPPATPAASAAPGAEPVDWNMVSRMRDEGFRRSEVMETARHLTEEIGHRLTGSPGMRKANQWTRDRLAEWGLSNAQVAPWGEFGRGWSFDRAAVHLVEPFAMPLIALPEAWTPGTDGPVRGEVVRVTIESADDLEAYRGRLAGKVLLMDEARELRDWNEDPVVHRYDEDELTGLTDFEIPGEEWEGRGRWQARWELRQKLPDFLDEEGVVATIEVSSRDGGLVRVGGGGSREPDENPGVTGLVMSVEHYNRLARLAPEAERNRDEEEEDEAEAEAESGDDAEEDGAEGGEEAAEEDEEPAKPAPVVEIDVVARFHDDDLQGYNTFADLPGGDLADELVMVGAHLDSWHGSTGATDNAAGSAIVMEAVRILAALDARPRRTIRVALWSGEEQGLLGSRAWAEENLGSRPEDPEQEDLPRFLREETGPLTLHALHDKVSGYFNIDNGGGKLRGIYTQGNVAVAPIFRAWLEPFHDLGATTVTNNDTGGTDHLPFDAVGVPGFQFIQDGMDYFSLTHHTNADGYDHLSREDMMQASVVLASFLYHAAMRDEMLPREPLPPDPEPSE
jgi:carboxypeptidase Q